MRVLWISDDYFGTLAHGDQIHLSSVGNILGIQRGVAATRDEHVDNYRKRCATCSDHMTFYGMKYSDFTNTCFQSPWNSNRRWDPILVQVETNHRNIRTNHQCKVSYLASWTTGQAPFTVYPMFWSIFAGLLSKNVRNRIRILLGSKQTKIHTNHEKKTISQNENKIIKATEKKWCSLCLSLLYMRPLRAMHFDSKKRYFFFKNETFIMIRYCTVRGASCHQQLKTKVNISSYPWKPNGETTSKSCEITSFWKSYHLPSTSNFFGASSPFVCGNVIRLLSK